MLALFVILLMTLGLAVRAGVHSRMLSPAESTNDTGLDTGLMDTCARTLMLVLLALLGLMALGMMYGNVLGSANAGT